MDYLLLNIKVAETFREQNIITWIYTLLLPFIIIQYSTYNVYCANLQEIHALVTNKDNRLGSYQGIFWSVLLQSSYLLAASSKTTKSEKLRKLGYNK